jgi:RNA polymerase sigma factor (sigma-70 family)
MIQQQNFGLSASDCEQLQAGNARLQTKVFDKFAPNYVRIAVKKWGISLEDAEDIVSGAFATLFLKVGSGQIQTDNLDGYVYTVVKHKCWEYAEKNKKNILETRDTLPDFVPEEDDNNNELMALINTAFNYLGINCQQLLTAFYWDKKDHKDIALALQITEEASRQRKRECMKKLKQWIIDNGQ